MFSAFRRPSFSIGSSTIDGSNNRSLDNSDVENPSSITWGNTGSAMATEDSFSPIAIKAPRNSHVTNNPTNARVAIPSTLPTPPSPNNKSTKSPIPPTKGLLDRFFENVESTVCRMPLEPEMPVVMNKRVMVDERQDNDVGESPRETISDGDVRENPAPSPKPGTPVRSILKKDAKDDVTTLEKAPADAYDHKSDLLDYVFENVESFVCRDKRAEDEKDDNNIVARVAKHDGCSPTQLQRVHKLPRSEGHSTPVPYRRDMLDYMFECGRGDDTEEHLKIYPTAAKDRDILDYMFECGAGDEEEGDCREVSRRVPLSTEEQEVLSALPNRDSNSIFSGNVSVRSGDSNRIGRVELLRNKKRLLEIQRQRIQTQEPEPRYLVPRGYREKVLTELQAEPGVSTRTQVAALQLKLERSRRIRRTAITGCVMFLVGTALILIAASFFRPTATL